MCKKCGKEYSDKENYNWSCRTHKYDYSGEMWWCCGKRGRDQPGCQQDKHETKDDEDEDDVDDRKKEQERQQLYKKCQCCKELGHDIDQCPRDPNIKTKVGKMAGEDFDRILKIKDNRKLFVDTMITTTHLLKKCVKVPKPEPKIDQDDQTGQTPD